MRWLRSISGKRTIPYFIFHGGDIAKLAYATNEFLYYEDSNYMPLMFRTVDGTLVSDNEFADSVEKVADDAGESKDQVRRYIRLTYLIPELLSMVDDGKIAFNPAVELSYLDSYQQRAVLDAMALNDCAPSHAQSIRLKKLAQEGVLDDQMIYAVLAETKPNQQEQLKFKREELRKYFPSGYTEEQMRRDIIKGLELLKRQRERNRDAR